MANRNDLVVTAGLNIEASVSQITRDLEEVSKKIPADALKIKCSVDTSNIKAIQSQLRNLSKGLKLDVFSDNNNNTGKNITNDVVKAFNDAFGMVGKMGETTKKEFNAQTKQMLQDFKDAWQQGLDTGNTTAYYEALDKLGKRINDFSKGDIKLLKEAIKDIRREFSDGSIVSIGDSLKKDLDYLTGSDSLTRKHLDALYGSGKYTIGSGNAGYDTLMQRDEEASTAILNAAKKIIAYQDKIRSVGWGLDELQEVGLTTKEIENNIEDAVRQILGLPELPRTDDYIDINVDDDIEDVKELTSNVNAYDAAIKTAQKDTANFTYPDNIGFSKNTEEILANAKKIIGDELAKNADTANDKVSRIKKAIEDAEGGLQAFIVQVEKENKSVETLTYALNEQGDAYVYLGKTIREADNSTDFRSKDVATQWQIQAEKLIQFANNADKAGLASTSLKDDIKELFASLNKANPDMGGDTSSMNAFLDKFDIAKAKFQAFNSIIRKDNSIDNFNNKIKKLTADMTSYAAVNERVTKSTKLMSTGKTFAEEWSRLVSQMAKGADLTDRELKQLTTDMAVFKKEAKGAGLEGASAFQKFANSFKLISTYISANQLINMAISKIREAVTELKEIDNILTEISKTSDRTAESLRKLGEESFDVASTYGRTASDYLLGVQEMSRAGFGELQSEQLAELSLKAQAAGDMTADMANEYIIATNAAYALQGNEEKLNKVLDSQNYITNHNAVNMENLAQATKIAASQASASGVAIDELTAAVGTMVAVTQQGGDQAGRAFKGILMNIQQVKASAADIGDGGEDITAESLSKYEKASAALGVALKEVKNGTLQLREPMEVLRDLAEAVSKESEGSIKVANLISAVGGKFRGNQLIALLKNWETYEKMLSEFNSDKAVGSAMDEAMKSANNWAGSINKVKNSWAELTSKFANSENMISILNSINDIIQSFTDSATSGALKILADRLSAIFKMISSLSQKIGSIPTLLTAITAINSIRGKGAFGDKTIDSLGGAIKTLTGNLGNYSKALDLAKLKTVGLKVATVALESAFTLGVTFVLSKAIESINNYIHAEERAAEEEAKFWQTIEDNVDKLAQEEQAIDSLISEYSDLSLNSESTLNARKDLADLQGQIIKDYGLEANAIDLVNGKYSEQIKALQDLKKEQAEAFIYKDENIKAYNEALDKLNHNNTKADIEVFDVEKYEESLDKIYEYWKKIGLISDYEQYAHGDLAGGQNRFFIEGGESAKTYYQTLDAMAESYKRLAKESGSYNEEQYLAFKKQASAAKEYYENYNSFVELYEKNKDIAEFKLPKETQKQFDELIDKAKEFYTELNGEGTPEQKFIISEKLKDVKKELYDLVGGNAELTQTVNTLFSSFDKGVQSVLDSVGDIGEAWLATLDDMQKGSLKNISTMVSALQDLSEGKGIAANTFWSLIEFDTEGLLNGAQLVGDKFVVTQEKMIELKDKYIKKQIDGIKLWQIEIENNKKIYEDNVKLYQLQLSRWKFSEKPLTNPVYRKEYEELNALLEEAKQSAKEYGNVWERNNWLIEYLNQSLGDTIDKQKELEARQKAVNKELTALNKELDNYVKAHEAVIDGVIKQLEAEGDELEAQKQTLKDELDILNEQKDTLEDTIKNYESVNKLVQNTVQKEIDTLKEQKQAIEDTYNARIDALKAENEERSDALEYAEKLANLENAKKNKRRVYDETRGWRYESVKEDVSKAKNDLADFKTQQAIKKLEKERDQETDAIDQIVKKKEKYVKSWDELLDSIQSEEDELLAAEILGADWREKITNGDTELMEKFRQEYQKHNTALQTLTKTEIKLKEEEIKAKDAEIDANKKRVESWKNYKNEVSTAVTEIKNANEEYQKQIGTIELDETSSLETRQKAFETFKDKVTGYVDEIAKKQAELETIQNLQDGLGGEINYDVHVAGVEELKKAAAAGAVLAATAGMTSYGTSAAYAGIGAAMSIANNTVGRMSDDIVGAVQDIMNRLGFASGGVADYTGLAMLHGRKNAPEVIFNASDSAKLYQLVHGTPNLMADMIDKATKLSQFNMAKVGSTTNTSSVNIDSINVYANNPAELSRGLDKELDRYFQTKLTQNYTSRS